MELTLRDVARLLAVSEDAVTHWVRHGELPAQRIRGQYWINKVELQEWAHARNLRISEELFAPDGNIDQLPSLLAAISRGRIHYAIAGTRREEVLRAVTALDTIPESLDRALLYELLIGRETLASTGIGEGIAIPHPRDPLIVHLDEPLVLLAFLQIPVDFQAIDGRPVQVLFTLLSPNVRTHLQMLSRLMFALHDGKLRELLRKAMPESAILARLAELESPLSHPVGGALPV